MFRTIAVALTMAGALAASSPASATILIGKITGTISSGVDVAGTFGAAGLDLTGQSFVIDFRFDTATPGAVLTDIIDEDGYHYQALNSYGAPSLGLTTFTIGGVTLGITGTEYAYLSSFDIPEGSVIGPGRTREFGAASLGISFGIATSAEPTLPAGYLTPYDGSLCPLGCTGFFGLASGTTLRLAPDQYTLTHGAAVPEPTTWALMIGGFGLAGAALRRRRTTMA